MKVQLTFKTPDVMDQIREKVYDDEDTMADVTNISRKWISNEEYITVEIDTDLETCDVLLV